MIRKFKQFLQNTSGNIAMTTALLAVPLLAVSGIAVDYSNFTNKRNSVQAALDASGLATASEFAAGAENEAALEQYAEDFFKANLPSDITPDQYEFSFQFSPVGSNGPDQLETQMQISATLEYDTMFGDFIGVDLLTEDLLSIISLGNRTVEVALVLDNSGSMGGWRINSLRSESKKLVETVFGSASLLGIDKPVQFSLVPFAGTVNVGPQNENASWMDFKGWADSHHENLDWENSYKTNNNMVFVNRWINGERQIAGVREIGPGVWDRKTRFDVFDMLGTDWGGCVEMRPYPHNIMDTVVDGTRWFNPVRNQTNGVPGVDWQDGHNALFVPYFAPDEPDHRFAQRVDNGNNEYSFAQNTDHDPDDDYYRNNYLYDFNEFDQNDPTGPGTQLYTQDNEGAGNIASFSPFTGQTDPQHGSTDQINRTNWVFKYQANIQYRGSLHQWRGPNYGCTTDPITPLTDDKDKIESAIEDMNANGTTNIQQGLTWGWRTLSAPLPFDGGRERDDNSKNLKIIILLSDGNNYYATDGDSTPNQSAYGAWGYARSDDHDLVNPVNGLKTHNRWLEGLEHDDLEGTIYQNANFDMTPESGNDFELIMNAHTNQACRNIKSDGVSIFAVAFDVPNSGGVRDLLEACAGSGLKTNGDAILPGSQFYFDVEGNELDEAFEEIARQITNLRIAK